MRDHLDISGVFEATKFEIAQVACTLKSMEFAMLWTLIWHFTVQTLHTWLFLHVPNASSPHQLFSWFSLFLLYMYIVSVFVLFVVIGKCSSSCSNLASLLFYYYNYARYYC